MKISVLNLLQGVVIVLAVGTAVAFTEPAPQSQTAWGIVNQEPLQTVQVQINSDDYDCDDEPTATCLFQDQQATMAHPQSPAGRFSLKP